MDPLLTVQRYVAFATSGTDATLPVEEGTTTLSAVTVSDGRHVPTVMTAVPLRSDAIASHFESERAVIEYVVVTAGATFLIHGVAETFDSVSPSDQ